MTTVILASNNDHKYKEMSAILRRLDAPLRLIRPKDLGFSSDVEETAETFAGNAALKAWGLFHLLRGTVLPGVTVTVDATTIPEAVATVTGSDPLPVIADDSGICVDALDGKPGVHSARFGEEPGGPSLDDEGRNDLLLRTLKDQKHRDAHYVCHMTTILDDERWVSIQETWHGRILESRLNGSTGFGYDPIVWLPDYQCSVAQLPQEQKDRISHRAKATRRVAAAAGWIT